MDDNVWLKKDILLFRAASEEIENLAFSLSEESSNILMEIEMLASWSAGYLSSGNIDERFSELSNGENFEKQNCAANLFLKRALSGELLAVPYTRSYVFEVSSRTILLCDLFANWQVVNKNK